MSNQQQGRAGNHTNVFVAFSFTKYQFKKAEVVRIMEYAKSKGISEFLCRNLLEREGLENPDKRERVVKKVYLNERG
jgi:hypothetical protein